MKDKNIILTSLISAVGVAVYVAVVSFLMSNGEKFFGKMDNFLGPVALLLLFVLSAAVTGALVLGQPAILFLDGRKAEAIKLFLFSVGWLLAITAVIFVALIIW